MIIEKTDPRYKTLNKGFNLRFEGQPNEILIAESVSEIIFYLQRYVNLNRKISVGSGFHCYEDFTVENNNGLLINLSQLNKVEYNGDNYIIEAGANLWDIV